MRRGIICGGCIVVDVNKSIDHYPVEERLAMIESESTDTGGPGLNLAVDLAKLGAPFPVEMVVWWMTTTGTGNWSGRCAEDPGFAYLGWAHSRACRRRTRT